MVMMIAVARKALKWQNKVELLRCFVVETTECKIKCMSCVDSLMHFTCTICTKQRVNPSQL